MLLSNPPPELPNSDLYTGYNEYDPLLDSKNLQFDQRFQQAVLRSAYGERSRTAGGLTSSGLITSRKSRAGSRRGTTLNFAQLASAANTANDATRPVTAVRAAGYTRTLTATGQRQDASFAPGKLFDPFNQQARLASGGQQDEEFIGMNKIKSYQLKVQQLYQESVLASQRADYALALEKARQAIGRERAFQKHLISIEPKSDEDEAKKEKWGSLMSMLNELSFANQVNLAIQLARNRLHQEAINVYQSLAKDERFNRKDAPRLFLTGRFKCNIGCLYYAEGKYQKAVKFFRMALDQMPSEQAEFRMKITRNIAFCFVKMGKYLDALSSFDYILKEKPLCIDAFRLMVCNYAIKDTANMRTSFLKLLELRGHLYEHSSLNYFLTLSAKSKEFFSGGARRDETFDGSLADSYDDDEDEDEPDLSDQLNDPMSRSFSGGATAGSLFPPSSGGQNKPIATGKTPEDDANLLLKRAIRNDLLSTVHNELVKQRNWCILTAAKLIAGETTAMNEQCEDRFAWCAYEIRLFCTGSADLNTSGGGGLQDGGNELSSFSFGNSGSKLADELIAELQLACAELYLLRKRELKQAIKILKVFEQSLASSANKRLWTAKCSALTNLAYIYLLQGQLPAAHSYLGQVLELDHLHVGALVNKGCCLLADGQLDQSREYFSEALLNEPNCVAAIYNLALANRQAGRLESALDLLFRLNNLVAENEFCIYQIANIYEQLKDRDQALDWYEQLLSKAPSDVYLLNKIGDLFDAFMYLNESYRQNPAYIPTLERLAAHYIETKAYEKAVHYLRQASAIEPRKIKWLLMVAACHIRTANYQQAIACYRMAHSRFPQNLDCLKSLFRLSEELGLLDEQIVYAERMAKLEKLNEQRERRVQSGDSAGQHSASSTSSFSRHSSIYQSTGRRLTRSGSKFSLNDEESGSTRRNRGNEASNQSFSASSGRQLTGKRFETSNELSDALFGFESPPEQRPMTSGRRQPASEEQLANDFTTEELARFLP